MKVYLGFKTVTEEMKKDPMSIYKYHAVGSICEVNWQTDELCVAEQMKKGIQFFRLDGMVPITEAAVKLTSSVKSTPKSA